MVEITAHDGISLIGHWCPCEEPKRTIVAMHGWRSSWSHDFGLIADFWRNNHCSVLYAEQRGQNNSGGDHMSLGLLERYDCLAWTNWINEKTGKSIPIYLAGVSMGATSVLMASELELPDNVFGIAADVHLLRSMQFGNMSPKAICIFLMLCIKQVPIGGAKSGPKWMLCCLTTERLKHCKFLFFLSTEQMTTLFQLKTYENYKACTSEKRLLIVPGADHCMSYLVGKSTYERIAKEFWEFCEQRKKNP